MQKEYWSGNGDSQNPLPFKQKKDRNKLNVKITGKRSPGRKEIIPKRI